jgi:LmbE family N-acetylglucosaminyl deacetylase
MSSFAELRNVVVVAPHADDEVLGCGGLLAKLGCGGATAHVVYMAVDGFHHYGRPGGTTYDQRLTEIEAVAHLLGFTWEIAYGDRDLIERLDTLPRRDLVDFFERVYNERRPDLLLLPGYTDYDQDHRRTFETAFAAARPIAPQFGKWLIPHVLAYEQVKQTFAWADLPRPALFTDIGAVIESKLSAIALYSSQLRPVPHVRSLENVRALARIRGGEIGVEYAEAYQVFRSVL